MNMKGSFGMPNTPELSEARRALLEKYLRGELPRTPTNADAITQRTQESLAPPSPTDSRVSLIPIQTGGYKRPFFFVHVHWQSGAFYCFPLSQHLGPDQPFYMLDPYNFTGLPVPPTFEIMAAAYIESMRTVQPEGPYLLGGFCGGGLIAFEMARQLRAKGQVVDFLVLLEPHDGPAPLKAIGSRLAGSFIRSIGALLRLDLNKQLDLFLRLRHTIASLRYSGYRNSQGFSLVPTAEALRQNWLGIYTWVISDYIPRYYPGKITYFWANEEPGNHRAMWGKVARAEKVEIHFIPGTHKTCRTDYVQDLAKELRTCLSKLQGDCVELTT
jgi:thioesterase domain-containing protein